jgi:hypothetical protein
MWSAHVALAAQDWMVRRLGQSKELLLFSIMIFVIAVRPSYGRAQTPEDDWREISPSAVPSETSSGVQDSSPRIQNSDSSSFGPTVATGTISGLRSGGNPTMDLRLRPQANGFLHGELVIHQTGFGMTPIEGFVRGNDLQFQVPYGTEKYYFEGVRQSDQISGTFESTPSGERGTWSAQIN